VPRLSDRDVFWIRGEGQVQLPDDSPLGKRGVAGSQSPVGKRTRDKTGKTPAVLCTYVSTKPRERYWFFLLSLLLEMCVRACRQAGGAGSVASRYQYRETLGGGVIFRLLLFCTYWMAV